MSDLIDSMFFGCQLFEIIYGYIYGYKQFYKFSDVLFGSRLFDWLLIS